VVPQKSYGLGLKIDWDLLSYLKYVKASRKYALNEDIRTWWSAVTGKEGEWLQIDLGEVSTIRAIQVNFANERATQTGHEVSPYYQSRIETSDDGKTWRVLVDKSTNTKDLPHEYIQLETAATAQFVRIVNVRSPPDIKFSLYRLQVFGKQEKAAPIASVG
jgi:hypothetical protein